MWHSIKCLYYKLYKLSVRIHGKDDVPEYTSMLEVGTLMFMNLLSVILIFNVVYPFTSFPEISRSRFFVVIGIPYIIILYFTFIYKRKYNRIVAEFINENESERKSGRKKVVFYVFFSFLLFIFSLVLVILHNEGVI
jgi:Ca2+/Na+ antiporter